jgi:pimeloyl-ACP methyl ester carboxylesterase
MIRRGSHPVARMFVGLAAVLAAIVSGRAGGPPDLDAALAKFWAAKDPAAAERVATDVVRSGARFEEVLHRLKQGRPYAKDVPTGIVSGKRRVGLEGEFGYTLDVPAGYDPARAYPVRVHLHGGVNRATPRPVGRDGIGRLAGAEQIYIIPSSWSAAPWWSDAQIDNLRAILDGVKRTYNVDEDRVVVSGVSDGGTGAFYVAMRDTTPYAAFMPLNGAIVVLRNPETGVTGDLFPTNLLNKPFFVVNGGRDQLYPAALVEPYLEHLSRGGVSITYLPQPEAGHDTSWWPQVRDTFETFAREHRRVPLPDRISWETSEPRTRGRAHWLVIEDVGRTTAGPALAELNELQVGPSRTTALFKHTRRAGRVDVVRAGNAVDVATRGVARLTLLVSPDQFDLGRPVTVRADGRVVFDGKLEPSVATLMKWAARDNDRRMLFGAEIEIRPADGGRK